MLRIAKALFSSDRSAGEDALWRKTLIRRLSDARIDMWSSEEEEPLVSTGSAAANQNHFDPPLETMTPIVTEEEPFDFSAWDRLDEQRHVMQLANAAAEEADRRARSLKVVAACFAATLSMLSGAIAFVTYAPGSWTTVVVAENPAPEVPEKPALAPKVEQELDKAERGYVHGFAAATKPAPEAKPVPEAKPPVPAVSIPPRLKLEMTASRSPAGEFSLPIGVSWPMQGADMALLVTGLPFAVTVAEGTQLPGGSWLLDPKKVDRLLIKNFPADVRKVGLRLDLTRHSENVVCTIEVQLAVQPATERMAASDVTRASPQVEKAANVFRVQRPSNDEQDEEEEKPQRQRSPPPERRASTDTYPNKSALGVGYVPSTPQAQAAPSARPLFKPTKPQPAWAIEFSNSPPSR